MRPELFNLDLMNKTVESVGNFHKSVITTHAKFTQSPMGMCYALSVVNIQTISTGAISFKIWNRTVWTMSLIVK